MAEHINILNGDKNDVSNCCFYMNSKLIIICKLTPTMAENSCSNQHKHRYEHILTAVWPLSKLFCLFLSDFIFIFAFSLFCLWNTKQQHFASYVVPCVSCLPVQSSKPEWKTNLYITVHLPNTLMYISFFMHLLYVNSTETQCVPCCFFAWQAGICYNTSFPLHRPIIMILFLPSNPVF